MPTSPTRFPIPKEPQAGATVPIPALPGYFSRIWDSMGSLERLSYLESLGNEVECPIIDPDPAGNPHYRAYTFFHNDPETTAVILSANALVDHNKVASSEFEELSTRGLWALTYRLPADWECGYRITAHTGPDQPPWRSETERRPIRLAADAGGIDPLNTTVGASMSGGAVSVVRGPGAPAHPWLASASPRPDWMTSIMGGSNTPPQPDSGMREPECLHVWDTLAGRLRTVWIYRPPTGTAETPTPLLILHDGQVWARYLDLAHTLDAAIADGVIPTLHVAMIDSLDVQTRSEELSGPVGSVDFVAADLLPRLRRELPVSAKAQDTIVSGASYGGLAALWQLARFPELVGCAVAQSPSLWRYDLIAEMSAVAPTVRVFLQAGKYETEIHETTQALHQALASVQGQTTFTSISGGHDWSWWNPWLVRGLAQALG